MMKRMMVLGSIGIAASLAQAALAADEFTPPQTAWGEPDLRGIWPVSHLIGVPVVRPAEFGERFTLTDEELAAKQASVAARDDNFQSGPIPQADAAGQALRQTSLIVDPPDGQFPELTDYGKQLQATMKGSYHPTQTIFDGIGDFSSWDRCITRGLPVSMLARNYNNGIRIFQTPGYVAIMLEMAHEVRIIPTDGSPVLDAGIKQWLGESRGRWEGNTLVVETTNFAHGTQVGLTSAGNPGSPGPLQPFSDDMKLVERFTRTAADTIEFEMTVEDPAVLQRGSYTYKFPMFLDNDYEIYEYACHEGNTTVRYYIETSRYERAQQAGGQVPRPVIAESAVPVETLAPVAADGFVGEAFLRKPPGDGPFPAVVLVHGGAPRWTTEALRDFVLHTHASRFLEAGYVVVAMTRRDLDLALPFTVQQPAVTDALAVVNHVKALPYVDADNVVVRGTSVGGYLTLEVAAATDVAAIMVEEPFAFPFVGIAPGAGGAEDGGNQAPDTSKIARINTPILQIEGDQTPNINEFNRDVFIPAVQAAGKDFTLLTYPGELHSFAFYDSEERTLHPGVSLEAFKATDAFFREHLDLQPIPLASSLVQHELVSVPGK